MRGKRKKYVSLFIVALKNRVVYRAEFVLEGMMMLLYSLIGIFLWMAVYHASSLSSINGITLSSTIVYFIIVGALGMLDSNIIHMVIDGIKSGAIATQMIRPMNFFMQELTYDISGLSISVVIVALPVIIITLLLAHISVSFWIVLAFIAATAMAYILDMLIGFIIGMLSIHLTEVYGIYYGINVLIGTIGGGLMPVVFFPQAIVHILMLTPLPYLIFVPAGVLTGMVGMSTISTTLAVGTVWCGILAVLAYAMWSRMSRSINAVGI